MDEVVFFVLLVDFGQRMKGVLQVAPEPVGSYFFFWFVNRPFAVFINFVCFHFILTFTRTQISLWNWLQVFVTVLAREAAHPQGDS
jgi:hypothetical protein